MAGRARAALVALSERRHHFTFTGAFQGRDQSEDHSSGECDAERENQNAIVDREFVKESGERNTLHWIDHCKQRKDPMGKQQTARAAEQCEQHALGEKLSHQTRSTRAKSAPQCQLARTRNATRELKVRDVRAAD